MKTFETEKGNIPEGATHYCNETSADYFAWVKFIDGDAWRMMPDSNYFGRWLRFETPNTKLIPQTKEVEWVNGLPPTGVECEWIGGGLNHGDWGLVIVHAYNGDYAWIEKLRDNSLHTVGNPANFRKPETPEQKLERERVEAAKHLYSKHCVAVKHPFKDLDNNSELLNAWLVIVDETNYKVKGE